MIDELRLTHSVRRSCRALNVSSSGYYAWKRRQTQPPAQRAAERAALTTNVQRIYQRSRSTYGSPRIHAQLRREGIACSRQRIERLMRTMGLRSICKRRKRMRTTVADPVLPVVANLLDRHFNPPAPNEVWVADVTYIATLEGWLYWAVVIDPFSRKVIGSATSTRFDRTLVCNALQQSLATRTPPRLHHSDRGAQYASLEFRSLLRAYNILPSMSRAGQCRDNAPMESFFASAKADLGEQLPFANVRYAERALFNYVHAFYNRFRLHSTLGYRTPDEVERSWYNAHTTVTVEPEPSLPLEPTVFP
ncbi:MAG: IS3 family transposase [Caldilineaceae bacterium]|jgi:transposase InsO family protein